MTNRNCTNKKKIISKAILIFDGQRLLSDSFSDYFQVSNPKFTFAPRVHSEATSRGYLQLTFPKRGECEVEKNLTNFHGALVNRRRGNGGQGQPDRNVGFFGSHLPHVFFHCAKLSVRCSMIWRFHRCNRRSFASCPRRSPTRARIFSSGRRRNANCRWEAKAVFNQRSSTAGLASSR